MLPWQHWGQAFTWNVLINSKNHYELLFRNRVTLATVAYFTSIIVTSAYLCCIVIFNVGQVGDCQSLTTAYTSAYALTFPANSVLFLLRIRAVFAQQRVVTGLFVLGWLGLTGSAMTLPFASFAGHIGPTSYCVDTAVKPGTPSPIIASAVFDTLAFFFNSWRLLNNALEGDRFRDKIKVFFSTNGLPALSKEMLYSGHVYYLITICVNVTTVVLLFSPVTTLFRSLLTTPNCALTCMMAGKVYMDLKLRTHEEELACPSSFVAARHTSQISSIVPELPSVELRSSTLAGTYPINKEEDLQISLPQSFSAMSNVEE